MNCYYCGSIVDEEKNICTRCGRESKEIIINLDKLSVVDEIDSNIETDVNQKEDNQSKESNTKVENAEEESKTVEHPVVKKKVVVKLKPKTK